MFVEAVKLAVTKYKKLSTGNFLLFWLRTVLAEANVQEQQFSEVITKRYRQVNISIAYQLVHVALRLSQ